MQASVWFEKPNHVQCHGVLPSIVYIETNLIQESRQRKDGLLYEFFCPIRLTIGDAPPLAHFVPENMKPRTISVSTMGLE